MAQRYSDLVMEHFMNPHHQGTLERADGTGVSGVPGRGPFMVFQILCEESIIKEAWFRSHNCGVTVACGSVLTEMVAGLTLEDAANISVANVVTELDGVPIDKQHVPEFALRAARMAIAEALS